MGGGARGDCGRCWTAIGVDADAGIAGDDVATAGIGAAAGMGGGANCTVAAQEQLPSWPRSGAVGAGDEGRRTCTGPGLSMLHIDIVIVAPAIVGMKPYGTKVLTRTTAISRSTHSGWVRIVCLNRRMASRV